MLYIIRIRQDVLLRIRMCSVFNFIDNGLDIYSDNGGIYDTKLKQECKELNVLLNDITEDDYQKHLDANSLKIGNMVDILFGKMQFNIYVNLNEVVKLLWRYQQKKKYGTRINPKRMLETILFIAYNIFCYH